MSVKMINITPSPRVLRMLGEINFKAWQCICELIDNSIDAFGDEWEGKEKKISIAIPSKSQISKPDTYMTITDNGSGMSAETLEKSISAGFSFNNPVDKMGLFGMGFNIATARLGGRTEIKTTSREMDHWLKVVIDFKEIEKSGAFDVPIQTEKKTAEETGQQGTIISISQLRMDHFKPLRRKDYIKKKIGRVYARVIREKLITITYEGSTCLPFQHCIWDESRTGFNRGEAIPAKIDINHSFSEERYCTTCWFWLSLGEAQCPSCNSNTTVVKRERKITGWLGLQRHFDQEKYGIDLIRNGRLIEEFSKDFFYWENDDQEKELEYPIDGHEKKGRIVGELEIDFVTVTHTKDAFAMETREWQSVRNYIRGAGPMRPDIAKRNNYPKPDAPLAKIFSAFRGAKAGKKNLVPARASGGAMITDPTLSDMFVRFQSGDKDYQTDKKWYDLILRGENGVDIGNNPNDDDVNDPFTPPPPRDDDEVDNSRDDGPHLNYDWTISEELSKSYKLDFFPNIIIEVEAREATGEHDRGFEVEARGKNIIFTYWPSASIYGESLQSPGDFLINELSYQLHLVARNELSIFPLTYIEMMLRQEYFPDLLPNLHEVKRQHNRFKEQLKEQIKNNLSTYDFDPQVIDARNLQRIKTKMAKERYLNKKEIEAAIFDGEFTSYCSYFDLFQIIESYPQVLFDGRFFNRKIKNNQPKEEADQYLIKEMIVALQDLVWFDEEQKPRPDIFWRARVKRVIGSLLVITAWQNEEL